MKRIGMLTMAGLFSFFALSGCGVSCSVDSRGGHEIFTDKYFEYYIQDGEVEICGLTQLGYEQSTLVIPAYLGGYPVTRFGGYREFMWDDINPENLTKIIFLSNNTYYSGMNTYNGPYRILKVILSDFDINNISNRYMSGETQFYTHADLCDELNELIEIPETGAEVLPTNVSFMYNFNGAPNEGYFMLDHVEEGQKLFCPYEPMRSGHSFIGWSLDPQSDTVVDISSVNVLNEEIILYANWRMA